MIIEVLKQLYILGALDRYIVTTAEISLVDFTVCSYIGPTARISSAHFSLNMMGKACLSTA